MAVPTVASRFQYNDIAGGQTAHVIPFGVNAVAGQVIVIFTAWDTSTPDDSINVANFPGWVKLGTAVNGVVVRGSVFYLIAAGGENTVTIDLTAAELGSAQGIIIDGGTTPTGTSSNGSSTNSNPPSHDHGSVKDILWLVSRAGDAAVVATVAPTNYTNLQSLAGASSGASMNTAERGVAADQVEDPGTFTSATEQWVCWTVAVPEAAAAGAALVAALVASGAVVAGLTTDIRMQASLTGSGSLPAPVLTTAIRFLAALTGSGTVTADLTSAGVQFTAALQAAGLLTADLETAIRMAASLSGSGTVSAGLTTQIRLAAALSGNGTVAADLTTAIRMAAVMQASGALTPGLTTAIRFAAAIVASGTLTPSLLTAIRMAAALQGSGALVGELAGGGAQLAAVLAGGSSVEADLSTAIRFLADLQAQGSMTAAELETAIRLMAELSASASLSGPLTDSAIFLSASLGVSASLAADLLVILTIYRALWTEATIARPGILATSASAPGIFATTTAQPAVLAMTALGFGPRFLTSITLTPGPVTFAVAQTQEFTAHLWDQFGQPFPLSSLPPGWTVAWSRDDQFQISTPNPGQASLSTEVWGIQAGADIVRVRVLDADSVVMEAASVITVLPITLHLDPAVMVVAVGDSFQAVVTATDSLGNPVSLLTEDLPVGNPPGSYRIVWGVFVVFGKIGVSPTGLVTGVNDVLPGTPKVGASLQGPLVSQDIFRDVLVTPA